MLGIILLGEIGGGEVCGMGMMGEGGRFMLGSLREERACWKEHAWVCCEVGWTTPLIYDTHVMMDSYE